MKSLAKSLSILIILGVVFAVVPSDKTNLPVLGAAKSLYGQDSNNNGIQLVGTTSGGKVIIDSGAKGIIFSGSSTYSTPNFVIVTRSATITTGNVSIPVKIGGIVYYLKAHTSI